MYLEVMDEDVEAIIEETEHDILLKTENKLEEVLNLENDGKISDDEASDRNYEIVKEFLRLYV